MFRGVQFLLAPVIALAAEAVPEFQDNIYFFAITAGTTHWLGPNDYYRFALLPYYT